MIIERSSKEFICSWLVKVESFFYSVVSFTDCNMFRSSNLLFERASFKLTINKGKRTYDEKFMNFGVFFDRRGRRESFDQNYSSFY
jgi:hypothetical protein